MKKTDRLFHAPRKTILIPIGSFIFVLALHKTTAPRTEEESDEKLAREIQNPAADLASIRFQNNCNFNYSPPNDLIRSIGAYGQ